MEGSVWLTNCNNYYRHPDGKVVTQFPYSGTRFVEMLARIELDAFDPVHTACHWKEIDRVPGSTTLR